MESSNLDSLQGKLTAQINKIDKDSVTEIMSICNASEKLHFTLTLVAIIHGEKHETWKDL